MARSISVYREGNDEALYDEPLGSEASVRRWWSGPAATLGLPLIAAIYDHGFSHGIRWSGPDLARALAELARLEEHWASARLLPGVGEDLAERAGYLRAAVSLAEGCGGSVCIS